MVWGYNISATLRDIAKSRHFQTSSGKKQQKKTMDPHYRKSSWKMLGRRKEIVHNRISNNKRKNENKQVVNFKNNPKRQYKIFHVLKIKQFENCQI